MSISPEKIAAHKLAADRLWIIKKLGGQIEQINAENNLLRGENQQLREALETMLTATTNDGKEQFPGHYSAFLEQVAKPRAKAALRREDV